MGSFIVVRQDKKPLFPLHVEALCKFCRYGIRPLLGHSIGEYAPEKPMERDAVLAMICRPAFVICWYRLLDEKDETARILALLIHTPNNAAKVWDKWYKIMNVFT